MARITSSSVQTWEFHQNQRKAAKLVGAIPTPLTHMSSSVGIIVPYGKIKVMFQTTNQKSRISPSTMVMYPTRMGLAHQKG